MFVSVSSLHITIKGMQYIQERCLECALQPLWLTSTVTVNLHKVLNDIVVGLYFLFSEKHRFNCKIQCRKLNS